MADFIGKIWTRQGVYVSLYLAPETETVPRKNDYDPGEAGGVRDSTKNICLTQATGATIKVTGGPALAGGGGWSGDSGDERGAARWGDRLHPDCF